MMQVLHYGRRLLEIDIPDSNLVVVRRHAVAPPLTDPAAAVAVALEAPLDYPPLRRALTRRLT